MIDEHGNVLRLFRRAMPGVAGVVLSDEAGATLAHDLTIDPSGITASALTQHKVHNLSGQVPGASTLVTGPSGLYLVVFLSPDMVHEWARAGAGTTSPSGLTL